MSFILDALRKVEREKFMAQQPAIDIRSRVLGGFDDGPSAWRRSRQAAAIGALVAVAGAFWLAAGIMERRGAAPGETAAAITRDETAVSVSTAAMNEAAPRMEEQGRGTMPANGEEARNGAMPSAQPLAGGAAAVMEETGAGPREVAEEVSPRETAGLASSPTTNQPRGTEPPASITQAAPAPVFTLDGIIHHPDATKRAAMVRARGGDAVLLRMGDALNGYTVSAIEPSRVLLVKESGKRVELTIE